MIHTDPAGTPRKPKRAPSVRPHGPVPARWVVPSHFGASDRVAMAVEDFALDNPARHEPNPIELLWAVDVARRLDDDTLGLRFIVHVRELHIVRAGRELPKHERAIASCLRLGLHRPVQANARVRKPLVGPVVQHLAEQGHARRHDHLDVLDFLELR